MQEVLVKWQIMTRLEEMCLISSTEWWWCASTPPLCLAPSSRYRMRGSGKVVFHYTTNAESTWIWKWLSNTCKAKINSFKWKEREKAWKEREQGSKNEAGDENTATRQLLKQPLCMKVTVLHRIEFTSLSAPWNVCTSSIDNSYKGSLHNGCTTWVCEVFHSIISRFHYLFLWWPILNSSTTFLN